MLDVKVLGPGCQKCRRVEQMAMDGLEVLLGENPNQEVSLEHIDDLLEIEQYPILFTPALIVNEK